MRLVNTTSGMLRLFYPAIKFQTDLAPGESVEIRFDQLAFLKGAIDVHGLKVIEDLAETIVDKKEPTPIPADSKPVISAPVVQATPKPVQAAVVKPAEVPRPPVKEVDVTAALKEHNFYSRDELQVLTKAQLLEILIDRKIEFSGSKEDIIAKILELRIEK